MGRVVWEPPWEPEDFALVLGDELRTIREARCLTRADMGYRTGISYGTVESYEAARRSVRLDRLRDLCNVLEVPVSNVMELAVQRAVRDPTRVALLVDLCAVKRGHRAELAALWRWADGHELRDWSARGVARLQPPYVRDCAEAFDMSHRAFASLLMKHPPYRHRECWSAQRARRGR